MTLISTLAFVVSFTGVIGFMCWDQDIEVPVLYSFGTFLARWWFNDRLKPGKPHLEPHDRDGPPLVAKKDGGNTMYFPYPSNNQAQTMLPMTYDDTLKMDEKYTPVNGLYGVSNVRKTDRTLELQYYPNAVQPNDYIAARIVQPHADWMDLEDVADGLKLYNPRVFSSGTPYGAATVGGPGNYTSLWWRSLPRYAASDPGQQFMPPVTSTGKGLARVAPPNDISHYRSVNDYSGGEYDVGYPNYAGSYEDRYVVNRRLEDQYACDKDGNPINSKTISSFPNEVTTWKPVISYGGDQKLMLNSFYDAQAEGGMTSHKYNGTVTNTTVVSWGSPSTKTYTGYYTGGVQKDYIISQLSQENPISTLEEVD